MEKFTQKIGSFFCHTVYFCFVTFCYCHHVSRFLLKKISWVTGRTSDVDVKTCTQRFFVKHMQTAPHRHNRFMALFRDHPGEPVPEENFWTLWCKGRSTEADTQTIRLGATPSWLTSAHLHHPRIFYSPDARPSCRPTNSVIAQKAISAFGLGRRR